MTPEEALALVRHAFRRDAWREIDQRRFIHERERLWWHPTEDNRYKNLLAYGSPVFLDLGNVFRCADRTAFAARMPTA